jgi:transcription initiation factor TFIID TATA-box-binding protein
MLPKIVNVVSTFSLNCELNLRSLKEELNCRYDPSNFTALIYKLSEPDLTLLLFPNGKVVSAGAKDELQAKLASFKIAYILTNFGYDIVISDYKIRNIVATANLHELFPNMVLDLNEVYKLNLRKAVFEPELFPALTCTINDIKVIIFRSGKVNFTGGKNIFQIRLRLKTKKL